MTIDLFAYGTLQLPEVFRAVTGLERTGVPARLRNHARYRLAGRAYPGLLAERGAVTAGLLFTGIDAAALRRLDAFEDDFYRRQTLPVERADGSIVSAEVYAIPPEHADLVEPLAWSLKAFCVEGLADFLGSLDDRFHP